MAKYKLIKYGAWKYGNTSPLSMQFTLPRNLKEIDTYPYTRVEILDKDDNAIGEIDEQDIISIDTQFTNQNGTRRTATLVLSNEDNKYTPQYRKIWIQTRFKIYSCQMVNGEKKEYSRGIYVILNVDIDNNIDQPTITFTLSDKYSLLNGELAGTLPNDIVIDRNISIIQAVRSVLALSSDNKNPLITNTDLLTFYNMTVEAGNSIHEVLEPLLDSISYQFYYNKDGIFTCHPAVVDQVMEYSDKASVFDFAQDDINFIDNSIKQDFTKIKNSIIVVGENPLGSLVRSEKSDNYIFSTTRKEFIDERVKVIYDKNISTQELADVRAAYELFVSIRLQEQIEITCSVIDYIKENDIISIQNSMSGIPERFLVNSVSYNSNSSTMSMSVWKIRNAI